MANDFISGDSKILMIINLNRIIMERLLFYIMTYLVHFYYLSFGINLTASSKMFLKFMCEYS